MNYASDNKVTNAFTSKLLAWTKISRLTIDDTRLVKAHAIKLLHAAYPACIGDFDLDIQYFPGGEYAVIPRNLITGLAICDELPVNALPVANDLFRGKKGTYEFNGKNLIFRPYIKPETVYIDMSVRNSG